MQMSIIGKIRGLKARPHGRPARAALVLVAVGTLSAAAVCARFLDICRAEDQLEGTAYLARRGIDAATARRAGVTYFPRRAIKGHHGGIGRRALPVSI